MDAKTFKSERKKAGLTLEEVGKAMGISKQSVSHWEKENRPIPIVRQEQAKEIFANPGIYKIPKVKKVYLVMCSYDNLQDYEDNNIFDYVEGVFSTREKAKAFINSWVPHLSEGQSIIDNLSEIKAKLEWEDYETNAERVIYIHHEKSWNRSYCELTIDEREVDI